MSRDPLKASTIDDFFSSLEEKEKETPDTYPGSRHKRRKPLPPPPTETVKWDKNGYVKIIGGRKIEMFNVGALAKAVHRSPNTIRSWTELGYIPQAPFRLPSQEVNGKMVPGRRLYTRPMVEALIELFAERDLLACDRVEWKNHKDLPGKIQQRWADLYEEISTATPKE